MYGALPVTRTLDEAVTSDDRCGGGKRLTVAANLDYCHKQLTQLSSKDGGLRVQVFTEHAFSELKQKLFVIRVFACFFFACPYSIQHSAYRTIFSSLILFVKIW